jgi:photosystem II stability/assembly factor-like uncharacterized protein
MKKLILLFSLLTSCFLSIAQSWHQQSSGSSEDLKAVFFLNQNTGWIVGDNYTILKTTDGGVTWATVSISTLPFPVKFVDVFFTDANNGCIIAENGLVYYTTDGGSSWSSGNSSSLTSGTYRYVHFGTASIGYMIGDQLGSTPLIAKTTDGGATWSQVTFTNQSNTTLRSLQAIGADTVMITTSNQVWYSFNGGTTWNSLVIIDQNLNILKAFTFNNCWITNRTTNSNYVFKSTSGPGGFVISQGTSPNTLANGGFHYMDAFNMNNVFVFGFGQTFTPPYYTYNTTDGGANWIQRTLPTTESINDLCYVANNAAWLVGDNGEILKYGFTTSLRESNEANKEWKIYPTPTKDLLVIESQRGNLLEIRSTAGQLLRTEVIDAPQHQINVQELNPGVYVLKIEGSSQLLIKE